MIIIPLFLVEHVKKNIFFPLKRGAAVRVALPCQYK